jgi:hypothetical protein
MINLRCTKKLLTKLHISDFKNKTISTNILGDWYADYFNINRKQYLIFTNEITTLTVIIPVKELSTLIPRFTKSLSVLLNSIGINKEKIDIELKEMKKINFIQTKNKNLLVIMNDLAKAAKTWFLIEPDGDLSQLNLYLTDLLIGPSPYHIPKEKVFNLFHDKEEINFIQVNRLYD